VTPTSAPIGPAAAPDRLATGPETALAHATDCVPTARPDDTAAAARAGLSEASFAFAGVVVLLDAVGGLAGIVPLERLLAAAPHARLTELADHDPPLVAPGTEQEAVAHAGAERGGAVAVVDEHGQFVAVVPPAAMLGVLRAEHEEDLARLGGYLAGTRRARDAAEESVRRRLVHRLPWLLLGLLGTMASAVIVGAFEHQLDARVLLAFFVPGVVYMADAVGTQTEAILIRGLSVGVSMRHVIRRRVRRRRFVRRVRGGRVGRRRGRRGSRARARRELRDSEPGSHGPAMDVPAARGRPGVRIGPARDGHPGPAVDRGLLRDRRAARHVAGAVRWVRRRAPEPARSRGER
jgi:magnesium transporter